MSLLVLYLMWACAVSPVGTAIAYNHTQSPDVQNRCGDDCARVDIGGPCRSARNLVFSGHSAPPAFLGSDAEALAQYARCTAPDLIVIDTCYGASYELLEALASAVPGVLVVAAAYKLPPNGLVYGTNFYDTSQPPEVRAASVSTRSGKTLTRLRLDLSVLHKLDATVRELPTQRLRAGLVRRHPNLYQADLAGAHMLFNIPSERFR